MDATFDGHLVSFNEELKGYTHFAHCYSPLESVSFNEELKVLIPLSPIFSLMVSFNEELKVVFTCNLRFSRNVSFNEELKERN